ncbi:hypothetical protein SAMN02787142_6528 [Burkholderia sp. WP9]|nr:hypothetical protein SAMN02787142_6528 [Burkholderia sp. WP9]
MRIHIVGATALLGGEVIGLPVVRPSKSFSDS